MGSSQLTPPAMLINNVLGSQRQRHRTQHPASWFWFAEHISEIIRTFSPKQSRHIHGTLYSRFLPPLPCCFEPVCHLACPARALSQWGFGQYRFCGRVTTLSLSRNQNIFCWQPSLLESSWDSTYKRWDTKHWLKNVQIVTIVPGTVSWTWTSHHTDSWWAMVSPYMKFSLLARRLSGKYWLSIT